MTDREPLESHTLTVIELKHIHRITAKVVSLYGGIYLPIFIRLIRELERVDQAMDARTLALKVATDYDALSGEKKRHTF